MISTRYFDIPYGGLPLVDTMTHMGKCFSGLCALIVPYKRAGIGSDGYSSK